MVKDFVKDNQGNDPVNKNDNRLTPLTNGVVCSFLEGGVSDQNISNISLEDVFNKIVADENVRLITEEFRKLMSSGRTDEARQKKFLQSCFSTAAVFEGGTGASNCVKFTNIALADYDHLSPEEVERCRELLRNDAHSLMFYKSMGGHGNGFHILVPVMGVCDVHTHKIAWRQVNEYYDKLLGLKHDTQCSDVARKSILAHDPDAFYNPGAKPIYIDYSSIVKDRKPGRPLKNVHCTLEEVGAELNRYMKARNMEYVEGNRNNYIFNASCELNRYGVEIEEVIDYFNETAQDMYESEIRHAVESAYKRYPEQHGTKRPNNGGEEKHHSKTINVGDIEEYLLSIADFQYNLITQRYEIRWKDKTEWNEISDSVFNDIWRKVCKEIRHVPDKLIRNIIESSFSISYNPYIRSFETLKPWDGVTDYLAVIASMIHVKPEYEIYYLLKDAFKKWVVGVVASICEPKAYNKKILTFAGKQNTFKTTFFRSLHLPSWGETAVYVKNNFHDFNKDERLIMTQSPILCLDEISHLGNIFMDELKSLTSQTTINERRAYGHYAESRPRIASFCATSNSISFLTDTTGNNRFLVYEIEGIDCPINIPIDLIEGMWSQAYQLYKDGFQYWFTQEEDALIDKQNERYEVPSAEEDLISTYYRVPEYGETYKLVNLTNIIEYISRQYKGTLKQNNVKQALTKMGFKYKRTNTQRGYMVIEIEYQDVVMHQQSSDWSHLPPHENTEQAGVQGNLF